MSFAKYAQFYKDNGFFAGSKIKCTVTDTTFIGEELILSKDNEVIRSMTIPTSGKVEFFTDESGELTLSADNGTSTLSGSVEITNYATYNVTLDGSASDNKRDIYADNTDITIGLNETSKNVKLAYTGDLSNISVASSDHTAATATVNDNEITIRKASGNEEKSCVVTATVQKTNKYQEKAININVKKIGLVGEWATASDETIVNMVAEADAGRLNLNDYWNIGDTRKVTLGVITADTKSVMLDQPEQEIELVLMHDSIEDDNYVLASETPSHRLRPSFIIGLKNCLENLSPIDIKSYPKSVTSKYSSSKSDTLEQTVYFPIKSGEILLLDEWLNLRFYGALPSYIQSILKTVNVKYNAVGETSVQYDQGSGEPNKSNLAIWRTTHGTRSQKIALPSSYEVMKDNVTIGSTGGITGPSVYRQVNGMQSAQQTRCKENVQSTFDYSYEGTQFDYYINQANRVKKRGNSSTDCSYYTRTHGELFGLSSQAGASGYFYQVSEISMAEIYKSTTYASVRSFDKSTYASHYSGISPIMFV